MNLKTSHMSTLFLARSWCALLSTMSTDGEWNFVHKDTFKGDKFSHFEYWLLWTCIGVGAGQVVLVLTGPLLAKLVGVSITINTYLLVLAAAACS